MEINRVFYALLPITLVATGYLFTEGAEVFLWVISAYFLFALIEPWMKRLTKTGLSPILAALILVLVASGILFGLGALFYRASANLVSQVGDYRSAISHFYQKATNDIFSWIHSFSVAPTNTAVDNVAESATNVTDPAASLPHTIGTGVLSGIGSAFSALTFASLTPLLTFFMIAEKSQFSKIGTRILKSEERASSINRQITKAINSYFLGNLVLIAFSLPIFTLAFWLIGVKSYFNLGIISGILNLVPFLGFILASVLPMLDLLMNGGHFPSVIVLLICCFLTHFTIANVITPKVLGSNVDLNATTSTIALISWGHLWGPMGLLLAIPVTAIIKIFLSHSGIPLFTHLADLMCENPESLHRNGVRFLVPKKQITPKP